MDPIEKSVEKAGTRAGIMLAWTCCACIIAVIIALTIKLLLWIF